MENCSVVPGCHDQEISDAHITSKLRVKQICLSVKLFIYLFVCLFLAPGNLEREDKEHRDQYPFHTSYRSENIIIIHYCILEVGSDPVFEL